MFGPFSVIVAALHPTPIEAAQVPKPTNYAPVHSYPVQGRRGDGETPGTSTYACSLCRIDYQVTNGTRPACPLCEVLDVNDVLRRQIDSLAQELEMVKGDLRRAQTESDIVQTMRYALSIAEPADLAEIKAIAYRWRADPDQIVVLAKRAKGKKIVIEVRPRHGDSEVFVPISVGGVAFAASLHDLIKARGAERAMDGYAQAIAEMLA